MPKIVNHEERRGDIAQVALRVIAKYGIEKTTVRRIALEGDFSSGTLAHYFRDKADLLAFAFQYIADRDHDAIVARAAKAAPGLERLRISLDQLIYAPSKRGGVAVSIGFWSVALGNPELTRMHKHNYDRWRRFVRSFLREAINLGQIALKVPLDDTIDLMVGAVDGLCVAMSLESSRFPPQRRSQMVDRLLSTLVDIVQ